MPENILCSTNMEEVVADSDIILHVTPSKFVRETIKKYKMYVKDQILAVCSKGFETDTLYTLSEIVEEEMPNVKYGILCGPSHAEEVSLQIPTAIVIASKNDDVLHTIQNTFMDEHLRIYTSTDVKGVELGAALKNIIAFCAGIAVEQNLGDNTLAALITRGLKEITNLGIAMGANKETFYGLTGLGDLIVTCLSEHSRNRRAGRCIGRGLTIEETKKEIGMTILYNNQIFTIVDFQHVKPGKGQAFVRTKLRNLRTGTTTEYSFNAGEKLEQAMIEKRKMQFLYGGSEYCFMDMETYEQVEIPAEKLLSLIHI